MEFNLDHAISIFFSTIDNQNNYWGLYTTVAFGLLAFLSATKIRPLLIKITVSGFVVFAISNLAVICGIQADLVDISQAIGQYLTENKSHIPNEFHIVLQNIESSTKPIWLVFIFHIFSTLVLSVAMIYVGNTSPQESDEETVS